MATNLQNLKTQPQDTDPARALFAVLDTKRNELKSMLPPSINVDQFIGVCKTAVLQNPDLSIADRRTFFTACMAAANDGLFPDGKESVLNVYNTKVKDGGRDVWIKKVQYLPMAGGMIKKLYATGLVTFVDAAAVYEKDVFDYERGDAPRLIHKPTMDDNPGKIVAAYLVVKLTNGEIKREVMARRDIEKVRAASKAPDGPGWSTWYDQFAIKSVIKRGYKQLPKMPDFERVIENDNEAIGLASAESNLETVGIAAPAATAPALTHQAADYLEHPAPQFDADDAELQQVERQQAAGKRKQTAAPASDLLGDVEQAEQQSAGRASMAMTYASVADRINKAKDEDDLAAAADLIQYVESTTQRDELSHAYKAKAAEFKAK